MDTEKVLSIDAMPCYDIVVFIINKLAVDVQEYKHILPCFHYICKKYVKLWTPSFIACNSNDLR